MHFISREEKEEEEEQKVKQMKHESLHTVIQTRRTVLHCQLAFSLFKYILLCKTIIFTLYYLLQQNTDQ